jgi:hypothetical protein
MLFLQSLQNLNAICGDSRYVAQLIEHPFIHADEQLSG